VFELARQRPGLVAAFILACAVTLGSLGWFTYSAIYWNSHRNQAVQPWMTVGYIARSWDLPAPQLDALANLPGPKAKGHPQPLSEIAADRGVPVAYVVAEVEKAIAVLRMAEPQP
jgi:hypothetical protein